MIAQFIRGAKLVFTAAIGRCILLFAFAVTVSVVFGGGAFASADPTHESALASYEPEPASKVVRDKAEPKTPCKRPKARAHYGCDICQQHASGAAVSRTRLFLPVPRLKLIVADALGDRLALAAAQASARLVLASGVSLQSGSDTGEIIARTARIRN